MVKTEHHCILIMRSVQPLIYNNW